LCLGIQEVRHAKAVNTNLRNQLKRGNLGIASKNSEFELNWFVVKLARAVPGNFFLAGS
jgi:hypothetical protein